MAWFWGLLRLTVGPVLYLCWRPRSVGRRKVPGSGAVILVSNHQSVIDHFFTPLPLRRPVFFIGKDQYVSGRGPKGLLRKAFFKGVGIIPVDRSGGSAAERALAAGLGVLSDGKVLGIYPEGTRAPDGRLYKGKTGVARLALRSGAPVVPSAVLHTGAILPEGRSLPRLGVRPVVRFGDPIDFSRYGGREDAVTLREVTDEIMREVQKLSGQEYVDRYAAEVKRAG